MTIILTLRDAFYPDLGRFNAGRQTRIMAASVMGAVMLVVGPAAASPLSVLPQTALASLAAPLMIPEPASAALLIVGLTISAVAARRRRRRAKRQVAVLP